MRARGVAVIVVLAAACVACGPRPRPRAQAPPGPAPTPPLLRVEVAAPAVADTSPILGFRSYRLVPGLAAEVDFAMEPGAAVTAEFRASGPLVMDSHHHPTRDEVVIYGTGQGNAGRLHFTAPFAGVFSFLWAPSGGASEEVDVYLVLRGEAKVVKWIVGPPSSPTGAPDASRPGIDLDL